MQRNDSQISKQAHLQGQLVNNSGETRGALLLHDRSVHDYFSTTKREKEDECSWRTVDTLVYTSGFHEETSNITLQFTHNSGQIGNEDIILLWWLGRFIGQSRW